MSNLSDFVILNGSLIIKKSLKNLEIPDEVRDINEFSLEHCIELENISVHPNNKVFYVEDGVLFKKHIGSRKSIELVLYPACRKGDEYTIPTNVSVIGPRAFAYAKHLKKLIFEDTNLKKNFSPFSIFSTETGIKQIVMPSFFSESLYHDISELPLLDVEILSSSHKKWPKDSRKIYKEAGMVLVRQRAGVMFSPGRQSNYYTSLLHCDKNKDGEVFIPFEMLWNAIRWTKFNDCKKITAIVVPKYPHSSFDTVEAEMTMDTIIPIVCPRIRYNYVKNPIVKVNLLLGYLLHHEYYNDISEWEPGGAYLSYVIEQKNKILPYIFQIDRPDLLEFYAERNLITAKNIEKTYMNPAIDAGAIKCIEFLQKFKEEILLSNTDGGKEIREENGVTYVVRLSKKVNTFMHEKKCVKCDANVSGDVYLPFNVVSIERDAFDGCNNITSIIAPKFSEKKFDYEFNDGVMLPLVFPMIDFKTVKNSNVKTNLLLGYIAHPEYYDDENTGGFSKNTLGEDYLDHSIRKRKLLIPCILKMDRPDMLEFYAWRGCITSKNYENEFLIPAIEANAEKCIDFLKCWGEAYL